MEARSTSSVRADVAAAAAAAAAAAVTTTTTTTTSVGAVTSGIHPSAVGWLHPNGPLSASPVPPHYLSSLSINTGSNFTFLHGGSGINGPMASPASSPFRTPSGLPSAASVRHHWTHTPPPLDTFGRYGLGHSLYSLFPMMTNTADVDPYCMQSSSSMAAAIAARYVHKTPYHHLFDQTTDFGLYPPHHHHQHQHHAGLPLGSPYSPTLSIDPLELASPSSASLEFDRTSTGTPHEYPFKTGLHDGSSNFWVKHNSPSNSSSGLCYDNSPTTGTTPVTFNRPSGCYNCQTCLDVDVLTSAKNSDIKRSHYVGSRDREGFQDSVKSNQSGFTSIPTSQSQKHRNVVAKTVLSPPKATAPTLPYSQKRIGSDVGYMFKGTPAPPTPMPRSCYEQVARPTSIKRKHAEKDCDDVKSRMKIKCNNDERTSAIKPTSTDRSVTSSTPIQSTTVTDGNKLSGTSEFCLPENNAQLQVLNLSNSVDDDGQDDIVDVGVETKHESDNDVMKLPKVPKDELVGCDNDKDNDEGRVRVKQEDDETVSSTCHISVSPSFLSPRLPIPSPLGSTKSAIISNAATFWSSISNFNGKNNSGQLKPLEVTEHGFRADRSSRFLGSAIDDEASDKKSVTLSSSGAVCNVGSRKLVNSAKRIEAIVTSIASSKMNKNIVTTTVSPCSPVTKDTIGGMKSGKDSVSSRLTGANSTGKSEEGLDLQKVVEDHEVLNNVMNLSRHSATTIDNKINQEPKRCKSVTTKSPQMSPKSSQSMTSNVYHSHPGHLPWSWDISSNVAIEQKGLLDSMRYRRALPILEVSGSRSTVSSTLPQLHDPINRLPKLSGTVSDCFQHSMSVPYDLSVNSSVQKSSMMNSVATMLPLTSIAMSMSHKMSPLTISTGSPMQSPLKECVVTGAEVPALLVCSTNDSTDSDAMFDYKRDYGVESDSTMKSVGVCSRTNLSVHNQPAPTKLSVFPGKIPHKNESNSTVDPIVLKQFPSGTASIPVGIAVARLRQESHSGSSAAKQKVSKELRKISSSNSVIGSAGRFCGPSEDFLRHSRQLLSRREKSDTNKLATSAMNFDSNMLITGGTGTTGNPAWRSDGGAKLGTSFQTRWLPSSTHGHGVDSQSLWLGQSPYAAAPAPAPLPVQLGLESSSRQLPPLGYQLARDPISSHFFLIPTTNLDLMDRSFLWPNFASGPPQSLSSTSTTPTTVAPIPPAHVNHFQQYVYQQQQQLMQQEQQRASDLRLKQHKSKLPIVADKISDHMPASDHHLDVGLDLTLSDNIASIPSENSSKCPKVISSSIIPIAAEQSYPFVVSTANVMNMNPVPYFYDRHMSSASSDNVDTIKRSQENSDICLTPPSDTKNTPPPVSLIDSEKTSVHVDVVGMGELDGDSDVNTVKIEPLMTDACNQTETPPLTDDDDDDDDDDEGDGDDEDDTNSKLCSSGELMDSVLVKQEDSGVQCDLISVKSCDFSSSSSLCDFATSAEKKSSFDTPTVVTGLELLSNTIEEHEESHGCSSKITGDTSGSIDDSDFISTLKLNEIQEPVVERKNHSLRATTMEKVAVNDDSSPVESSSCKPDVCIGSLDTPNESESLGGLSLLCALAEQRILQENVDPKPSDDTADKEYPDGCNLPVISGDPTKVDVNNRDYKITKIQKEYKNFIAHKMLQYSMLPGVGQNAVEGTDNVGMDAAEVEMRMRLAELQKKYKEKQKELARLLPKKDHYHHHHHGDRGFSKRGPGRPRKRKLPATMFNALISSGASNSSKSSRSSSRREFGFSSKERFSRIGRPILKPSVLSADKSACATTSISIISSMESSMQKSPTFQPNFCPLAMGLLSFGKEAGTSSSTFGESLSMKGKSKIDDGAGSSSETSDSDDSISCSRRKRGGKRISTMSKRAKRKIGRLGRGDCADDDDLDLSLSFSSLSVSCTMPPFQGCEESTGLGMLARYAYQVVEQAVEFTGTIDPVTGTKTVTGSENDVESGGADVGAIPVTDGLEKVKEDEPEEDDADWLDDQEMDQPMTSPKRKPGRPPKKHTGPQMQHSTVETLVTKKTKPISFLKLDSTVCMTKSKLPAKDRHVTGPAGCLQSSPKSLRTLSETKHPSFLEDEAWLRRRSERIFLNEPSVNPQSFITSWSSSHDLRSSSGSGHCASVFSTWKHQDDQTKQENAKPKKRPSKGKLDSELLIKKSKPVISKTNKELTIARNATDAKSCVHHMEDDNDDVNASGKKLRDADPDSPGNSSFSEGDNLPLIKLIDRPITPEPKSCVIQTNELRDSLRVLTMMDGLFYAGYINAIRAPDVYGITVDGERGNRPHIYSREEILKEAIFEVKPMSMRYLAEGTRVCTYWSQQYRCLYPGTVSKPTSPCSSPVHGDQDSVYVEFDDGDSGRIPICNIRLLPPDLPIISYEPDPLIIGKRRRKSTGDISREKQSLVLSNEQTNKSSDTKMSTLSSETLISSDEPSSEIPPSDNPRAIKSKTLKGISLMSNPEFTNSNGADVLTKLKTMKSEIEVTLVRPTTIISKPDFDCPTSSMSSAASLASVIAATTKSTTTTITSSSSPSTSITVIAIGTGSNKHNEIDDQVRWKKHKKHKSEIIDRQHHHHHHHHHHRHKHRRTDGGSGSGNESFKMPLAKVTPKLSIDNNTQQGGLTQIGKKSDLTLTIKTTGSQPVDSDSADLRKLENGNKNVAVTAFGGSTNSDGNDKSKNNGFKSMSGGTVISVDNKLIRTVVRSTTAPSALAKKTKSVNDEGTPNTNTGSMASLSNQKNLAKLNKKGKEKASTNVESKSKMAAFLPARQLWKWSGKGFRRPSKGKARKEFYKSITRGKELIRVGDSAVFLSTGRPHLPYIGRIETMWESWGGNMVVKVKWFYHPEETKGGRRLVDTKGALYQSLHEDENDVQTISHKCEVLSWTEYSEHKQREASGTQHVSKYGRSPFENNDVYYLAGTYDPLTGHVALEPGVS